MSSYTDKVRPCTLRSGLSALGSGGRSFEEGSHLCFMYFKNEKIEHCHKLLLVLVVDMVQTRSNSRRLQVARIGLCGGGAVCSTLAKSIKKILMSISGYSQRPLTLLTQVCSYYSWENQK